MKFLAWNKKSIISFFTILTVIIVLLQTVFLTIMLIAGGVLKQTEMNSYETFLNTTNNRRDYLQQDMRNRWTNFANYKQEIERKLDGAFADPLVSFDHIMDDMIKMLRSTEVTGVFVILENDESANNQHHSLYLRDHDPLSNTAKNDDIYMVNGPSEIAKKYKLALNFNWKYYFSLSEENKYFYEKPMAAASPTIDSSFLGYWAAPFRLTSDDTKIITYSMPLVDANNQALGVIGVELTLNYLAKFLPASDFKVKDSLGYIIAVENDDKTMTSIISTNNTQKKYMDLDNKLVFSPALANSSVQKLENPILTDVHASIAEIAVYPYNSPFQEDRLYLVSFMQSDELLVFVDRIVNILKISVGISLLFGLASGIIISRLMSTPVVGLVREVLTADKTKPLTLKKTGLAELDSLSEAMIQTNEEMLESASRLSRIIDMVDLPVAAFEYSNDSDDFIVTKKAIDILSCGVSELDSTNSKDNFLKKIKSILANPEPDEEHIYILDPQIMATDSSCLLSDRGKEQALKTNQSDAFQPQVKWVKIKLNETKTHTYGIVQDVTEEILEKKKIIEERDLDSLTKLYNRKSFQYHFEKWFDQEDYQKISALVMFDLDFLKTVNDTYGHKWGDFYITETAKQLQKIAPPNQVILARRSGDEFVMLLKDFTSRESLIASIDNFYARLEDHVLDFPEGEKRIIRISAGYIWIEDASLDYEQLLHLADEALYYSKEHNKGGYTEAKR